MLAWVRGSSLSTSKIPLDKALYSRDSDAYYKSSASCSCISQGSLTTVLSYEAVGAHGNTQTKLFKYDDPLP